MKRTLIVDFPICVDSYSSFLEQILTRTYSNQESSYVCVANVHMMAEAHLDKSFAEVIHKADVITPDGVPLTWGLRLLHGIKQERVAGSDILPDLLCRASIEEIPVYFYGGTTQMLDQTSRFLTANYPTLKVVGMFSPPFRNLTTGEEQGIINTINQSGARLVFVVLGCPKQEKWMASMKGRINAVMIGIGGALPILVGAQKRAPKLMQKAGLEWLYRFYLEPRRLFKRYAVTNTYFMYLLFREYIRLRIFKGKIMAKHAA
jgi:N-acetylglucosaminyldiphosphoundecaprenol N-acetyl-beta-D-mannosaminyltransferase